MLKRPRFKLKEETESIKLREAGEAQPVPDAGLSNEQELSPQSKKDAGHDLPGAIDASLSQSSLPIPGKRASKLSDQELQEIATHPESVEADWLPAFTELSKREGPQRKTDKKGGARSFALCALAAAVLAGAALSVTHLMPGGAPHGTSGAIDPHSPYLIRSAQQQSLELKVRAKIRVAQTIDERGWDSAKAASYLGVGQTDLTDLINGGRNAFSMDELNRMLYTLGVSTVFSDHPSSQELQQTVAYYTRVIAVNPQNKHALDLRASAYEELEQYDLAIADLKRYVELCPEYSGPLNNLSNAYRYAGRLPEALATLNKLHEKFPAEDIYQNRSIIYMQLGDYEKSIADSTSAIAGMDSPRPGPYLNRAVAYEEVHKYAEAIADYRKVLEIDPTYKSAARAISRLENR